MIHNNFSERFSLFPSIYVNDTLFFNFQDVIVTFLVPPIAIIVLLLNSVLLIIFWKKRVNNTIHIFVAAICISDILYVILPAISSIYFIYLKTFRNFVYVPYEYCRTFVYISEIVPSTLRCFSIFLTVALATQRCLCVTRPLNVSTICTRKRTVMLVIGLLFLSCLLEMYSFIFIDIIKVNLTSGDTCALEPRDWAADNINMDLLFLIKTLLLILFVNTIPSIWLIITGILLVRGLRKASKWRKVYVIKMCSPSERDNRERKLTILTIWIILVLLMFHIPHSIADSLTAYQIIFQRNTYYTRIFLFARTVTQFCITLTLPSNFIIYIVTYRDYYDYLKSFFKRKIHINR